MKRLVLETTAPFQGLPEFVAYDEGLFEKEGLAVEWADREKGVEKKVKIDITSPKDVDPFASHGKLFEQGKADMYNACEWGNYCRVQATDTGSRQIGRRAIIAYAALVVRGDSPVYTPQQLANKTDWCTVLFWHSLYRDAYARGLFAARHNQAVQCT